MSLGHEIALISNQPQRARPLEPHRTPREEKSCGLGAVTSVDAFVHGPVMVDVAVEEQGGEGILRSETQ
jgi:hypothetical protein